MGILWIAAIGFGIYYLVKRGDINLKGKDDAALDALKARYVKGEIDEETYLKMKKMIEN